MPDHSVATTQYRLLMSGGGERVMTLPADWVITFGPNVPGESRGVRQYGEIRGWCFRVYSRAPKMLKACIPSVVEFFEEGSFDFEIINREPETNLVVGRASMDEMLGRIASRVSLARRRPNMPAQRSFQWDPTDSPIATEQMTYSTDPTIRWAPTRPAQGGEIADVSENMAGAEQEQGNGPGF